jgi:hypothetical protein
MTYTPPVDATDEYLAGLPWDQAQLALARGAPIGTSRRTAVCGWHGPSVDAETGAFAIVRSDGPLAGLVGERLQITYRAGTRERTIAVYAHDEQGFGQDASDEDLSVTRRGMLALAPLAWDPITVDVAVLA